MVVDLSNTNLAASELHNGIYNLLEATVAEELYSDLLSRDQLAHPVHHEGGQSGMPYHVVLLCDRAVPIRNLDLSEWHIMQHTLERQMRELRALYIQPK
jgi:hypothetical protein